MKRLSFIVMTSLLALGLTQCKKNEPINNNNEDNRVSITLKLDNGGQKVHPEEENGLANVVYDNGDVVYVGSDGKYMGYLTYNGSLFVGNINAEATEGQPLQFVFMGGQTIEGLTENSSTECTFNIGDQSNGLAVISGAASNEDFSLTNLSYTAYLRNKCALVKFDLGSVSTDAAITLTGMKNEVTVGFDGTVTNGTTTGDITTNGTGSTRYAVVLSDQEAVTEGTLTAEGYEGTFTMPAAFTNAYLTNTSMTLTEAATDRNTPLTFEAVTAGSTVRFYDDLISPRPTLEYKINDGAWTAYSSGTTITLANVGDKVSFRGDNITMAEFNQWSHFDCNGQCYLYGNIMSLLRKDDFANAETLLHNYTFGLLFYENIAVCNHPEKEIVMPATTLTIGCYLGMFHGCTGLTKAPALPATMLADQCYCSMFEDCTSLTMAPALPAPVMKSSCYAQMFRGCTSLTSAPELPATTLSSSCYSNMFDGCSSLIAAPLLPATTLADNCYSGMFHGCTILTVAPELPATTLANSCYRGMFGGCTNLTMTPALPATTLARYCYNYMFSGCTNLTMVDELPSMALTEGCYSHMFVNCTGLTIAPALPANTLVLSCYDSMFYGCTNLNSVKCLATDISEEYCTYNWLDGVASTGTFTKAAGVNWPTGANGIPNGWTVNEQ